MRSLQVLMPMAGMGLRFKNAGMALIKPLIEVQGEPMFKKALDSLPKDEFNIEPIFVIKKVDEMEFHLTSHFQKYFPKAKIVILDQMTRGALETCYQASSYVDFAKPLLILDCDLCFSSRSFFDFLKSNPLGSVGGALVSFESDHPRYSYAHVEDGWVLSTAEKKVISHHALAGAYYFSRADLFMNEAQTIIESADSIIDEYRFYIAPLYNKLIEKKLKIQIFSLDSYISFGTPEELALVNS